MPLDSGSGTHFPLSQSDSVADMEPELAIVVAEVRRLRLHEEILEWSAKSVAVARHVYNYVGGCA